MGRALKQDTVACGDAERDGLYQRSKAVVESCVPALKVLGVWIWFLHRISLRDIERYNYPLVHANT